jgi:tyrosinase
VLRRPLFDPATESARFPWPPPVGPTQVVLSEADTLNLGTDFASFREMEDNPHGWAHVSFNGDIRSPGTAPADPLFFLLHCNVDRLWAKWQRDSAGRFDAADPTAYDSPPGTRIGHRLADTMWPWNGSTTYPRPSFPPPGGGFATDPLLTVPGASPRVREMFDYAGLSLAANALGYDYDDVPNL